MAKARGLDHNCFFGEPQRVEKEAAEDEDADFNAEAMLRNEVRLIRYIWLQVFAGWTLNSARLNESVK